MGLPSTGSFSQIPEITVTGPTPIREPWTWVFYMGGRGPASWASTSCLARHTLTGSYNWACIRNENPGVLSGMLTTVPNSCPWSWFFFLAHCPEFFHHSISTQRWVLIGFPNFQKTLILLLAQRLSFPLISSWKYSLLRVLPEITILDSVLKHWSKANFKKYLQRLVWKEKQTFLKIF